MSSLLSLVMIVKNEEHSIRDLVSSVKDCVESCAVVDTGSIDATLPLLQESLPHPVYVHRESFVDYATTRNSSLEFAANIAKFGLVLSGDEALVGGEHLRRFCKSHQDDTEGAYNIQIESLGARFDSPRLVRLDLGWKYVGEIHEVLTGPGGRQASIRVPGCYIIHRESDPARKRSRLYRDLEILREKTRADPKDARSQFYVARTLEGLGFQAQAFEAYKRRVDMGGWVEERYCAALGMAMTSMFSGKTWPEIQQTLLEAYKIDPRHAEPLCLIARNYFLTQDFTNCWLFASVGASVPYPEDCKLFTQPGMWQELIRMAAISGWRTGRKDRALLEKALLSNPTDKELLELLR